MINIDFNKHKFLMFEMDELANQMEKNGEKIIRLTLGKSELPVHPEINAAIHNAIDDFSKSSLVYPSGLPLLKEKISKHYQEQYQVEIPTEKIIINVGTSSIFRNIFNLLIENETDEVLIPLPYYSLYHFSALLAKATIRYYKVNPETLEIDLQSLQENLTSNTKLVVLNSPGNPLGNVINEESLRSIDEIVNNQAYIISDEIYDIFGFDEKPFSAVKLQSTKSKFIITNAFSKGFRMYSRRVGYCIVPPEMVEPLTVMQHHTLLTVDPVVQYGAAAALDYIGEVYHLRELYKKRRDYTVQQLSQYPEIRVIPAQGGFYITIDCEKYMIKHHMNSSFDLAKDILATIKVATVPGSDFGLPNMLRLSFTSSEFNEAIDRLKNYFLKL